MLFRSAERHAATLAGTEYGRTPLRALLTMSSGVKFREVTHIGEWHGAGEGNWGKPAQHGISQLATLTPMRIVRTPHTPGIGDGHRRATFLNERANLSESAFDLAYTPSGQLGAVSGVMTVPRSPEYATVLET